MSNNIASLPPFYKMKYTNDDGSMTTDAQIYNDQLWQSLNQVVEYFNNGLTFPSKTSAEILAVEQNSAVGTVWFNTSLSKLQVKTASGIIETIESS